MSSCPIDTIAPAGGASGTGSMKKYGETNMYVVGPTSAKAGLLVFPDLLGLDSGRTKEDADRMGKFGYAVAVVDITNGDYLVRETLFENLPAWVSRNTFEQVMSLHIQDAIAYLKNEVGVERIASYGYCCGAWTGARQSALPDPVILGHVGFHPSWNLENRVNGEGAAEKLAEQIKVPQLLIAAGNDSDFVKPGGSIEKILSENTELSKPCEFLEFPDMTHGWVHRGDFNDPAVKDSAMKAWHTAYKFLQSVCPL